MELVTKYTRILQNAFFAIFRSHCSWN